MRAQDDTIKTLLREAWKQQDHSASSFAQFDRNVKIQQLLDAKTSELAGKTRELEEVLQTLAASQAELLQHQKLESVGRLAAGVAHEINTPIQFVSDSIHFLADAFADILQLYKLHQQLRDAVLSGAETKQILSLCQDAEENIDFSYLDEHVPKAIERCIDGTNRVAEIVKSMKEFAHPDSSSFESTDINRAIVTTATIARHEYKYIADLKLELGDIPLVQCSQGEFNQVILNLLVNAGHAIDEKLGDSGLRGQITIRTYQEEDNICITISDTGCGIPQDLQGQIFEPFFTTKPVGQGTGQGLPMARSTIVGKHNGSLTFQSTPGQGTTFLIKLPIQQPNESAA
ncbi:ATP-binding protein [Kamptonema cortianum]|nr:ATP-binding protein [Kamptonema cortianum]